VIKTQRIEKPEDIAQDKKTVLITGGTRGIGKALVEHYVNRGYWVIATGRSEETVSAAQKAHPNVQWLACNMALPAQRTRFSEQLSDTPLDLIIHNAGIPYISRPMGSIF